MPFLFDSFHVSVCMFVAHAKMQGPDQLVVSVADGKDGHPNETGENLWTEILEKTYCRNNVNYGDNIELDTLDRDGSKFKEG